MLVDSKSSRYCRRPILLPSSSSTRRDHHERLVGQDEVNQQSPERRSRVLPRVGGQGFESGLFIVRFQSFLPNYM